MSDEPDHEHNWGLLVAFTDPSPSYVHGFETGGLWERMQRGETPIELGAAHAANEEVHRRMAAHWGYDVDWQPMAGDYAAYAVATFTKVRAGVRSNPHGLRVVEANDTSKADGNE